MKQFLIAAFLATTFISAPVMAQDAGVGKRVDRLEKEMRAVQRKVFPGGDGSFFEPDIKAPTVPVQTGSDTTSAVSDLISRVDTLERSLATLTGQVEQNGFRLKTLEDRMNVLGTTAPASATSTGSGNSSGSSTGTVASKPVTPPIVTKPTPDRIKGVAAIVMPATGDAGEDGYLYGYRLWEAGYFPEAQAQLKKTVEKYPSHKRASYSRNLLGRAYLDDSKPALASVALYDNYQKIPRGERAPDSLYFLSTALVQLGKKPDACRVLSELQEVYPDVASGRLSDRVASGKKAGACK